jgi:hypothetical protein
MSNTLCHSAALAVTISLLTGCAGVTFYKTADLQQKTGIPIFGTKPYVMVSRTGAPDKPVDISIVRIADPNNVVYAVPHSGFGSSKLAFALSSGELTSFGLDTDFKVNDLITSLGGFLTSSATAKKERAAAEATARGIEQTGVDYTVMGKGILDLADEMQKAVGGLKGLDEKENQEKTTISAQAQTLTGAGTLLSDRANSPMAPTALVQANIALNILKTISARTAKNADRGTSLKIVGAWATRLEALLATTGTTPVASAPAPEPAFELYEIVRSQDGTTLRKVSP